MKHTLLALLLTLTIEASEHTREVYNSDLNHDGYKERVVLEYSGGAHCCTDMFIIQENKALPHRVGFSLSNQDDVIFKDIDKDGTIEMILYDDIYSYFGSLCFACSLFVGVIANFDGKALHLRADLMKKEMRNASIKLEKTTVKLDNKKELLFTSNKVTNTIEEMLYKIYVGHLESALNTMKEYLLFSSIEAKKVFVNALVNRIGNSIYLGDILELNYLESMKSLEEIFYK